VRRTHTRPSCWVICGSRRAEAPVSSSDSRTPAQTRGRSRCAPRARALPENERFLNHPTFAAALIFDHFTQRWLPANEGRTSDTPRSAATTPQNSLFPAGLSHPMTPHFVSGRDRRCGSGRHEQIASAQRNGPTRGHTEAGHETSEAFEGCTKVPKVAQPPCACNLRAERAVRTGAIRPLRVTTPARDEEFRGSKIAQR
jgi:hypothetical protein